VVNNTFMDATKSGGLKIFLVDPAGEECSTSATLTR
jgi:hypothetical protein